MAKKLKVTLVHSGINRPATQKLTIKGLGLSRPSSSRILEDSVSVRGMIRKISHLVRVEPVE
jgi:large subunit ribosomal protein L30